MGWQTTNIVDNIYLEGSCYVASVVSKMLFCMHMFKVILVLLNDWYYRTNLNKLICVWNLERQSQKPAKILKSALWREPLTCIGSFKWLTGHWKQFTSQMFITHNTMTKPLVTWSQFLFLWFETSKDGSLMVELKK